MLNFLQFTRFQVELALISQFPLDVTALSEALDRFWGRWDHDGSGYVSANEFVAPGKGLLDYARKYLLMPPVANVQLNYTCV